MIHHLLKSLRSLFSLHHHITGRSCSYYPYEQKKHQHWHQHQHQTLAVIWKSMKRWSERVKLKKRRMIDHIFEQFLNEIAGEKKWGIFCALVSLSLSREMSWWWVFLIYLCIYVEIEFSGKSSIHTRLIFFLEGHKKLR